MNSRAPKEMTMAKRKPTLDNIDGVMENKTSEPTRCISQRNNWVIMNPTRPRNIKEKAETKILLSSCSDINLHPL